MATRAGRAHSLSGRRRTRAAGERVAALFEEHGRMVFGLCRLLLRNPVDAEDAAQQTFLSAYRALLAGQVPREPSAWLGTIARNECRSRLRTRQAEPLSLVREPAGDELQRDLGRREEIQALCSALAALPPQQRDAVVLRELYGLSYAEVGAALGLSGPAVESVLFRGRRRLQEQLRPLRSALGMLSLPVTLRESLAQALPGFGAGTASAGAGAAVLAKVASGPVAAKVAAATLAVGAAGTVAGVEAHHAVNRPPAHSGPGTPVAQTQAAPRAAVVAPVRIGFTTPVEHRVVSRRPAAARPTEHRSRSDRRTGRGEASGPDGSSPGRDSPEPQVSSPEPEHHDGGGEEVVTTAGGGGSSGDSGSSGRSSVQPSVSGSGDGSGRGSDVASGGGSGPDDHHSDGGDSPAVRDTSGSGGHGG